MGSMTFFGANLVNEPSIPAPCNAAFLEFAVFGLVDELPNSVDLSLDNDISDEWMRVFVKGDSAIQLDHATRQLLPTSRRDPSRDLWSCPGPK